MNKVFVGLSGGVDSSLSAYLLKQQGYQVVGAYMKNWTQDIGSHQCPWQDDYLSAKKLATFLDIEFMVFDFQTAYKKLVVDYMINEYRAGLTPNPDIACNQHIKFNLFLEACLENGADYIATGHYARIDNNSLYIPKDKQKDQTYFLYRMPKKALKQTLFPLANLLKTEVRDLARKHKLPNANRDESMGICFVGEVGIVDFLKTYTKTKPGLIINDQEQVVGEHQGAIFYTIGQRKGLNIGGSSLPYYVTHKDMSKNIVYVSQNLNHQQLMNNQLTLISPHYLKDLNLNSNYLVRIRHQAPLVEARISKFNQDMILINFKNPIRALTGGQSAVIYKDDQVVAGGIIKPFKLET